MMETHDFPLPFPPDRVWQALPAAVQRTRRAKPGNVVHGPHGQPRFVFSTGMSMMTYGMQFSVDLYQQPDNSSVMRVTASLNFGFVDWGEGRKTAHDLYTQLYHLLNY